MFKSEKEFLDSVERHFTFTCYNFSVDVRHFICCQSALETGFGTSRICLENNNLFGMKKPTVRPTTCIASRYGHAVYDNCYASVVDYVLWLSWTRPLRFCLNDVVRYADHLIASHYSVDDHYIEKIMALLTKYYG